MELTFLESAVPLTKTFRRVDTGIEKSPYPLVTKVTSHHETCATIAGMYDALIEHAAQKHCLLKGNTRPLVDESRAAATNATEPTSWICLDIDGLPGKTSIDGFLNAIGIADVSYIVQYSASHGIESSDLRCHVFMWLTDPVAPPLIKQWLLDKNLSVPLLRSSLLLSRTHMSLRYGLDITTCQNDKLLYIAPPTLIDIADPFTKKKPRIKLVERSYSTFKLDTSSIPMVETNRRLCNITINELRNAQGLDSRPLKTSSVGFFEVMTKPEHAQISGIRTDRGFTYLNLNGGDSWGYYHPDNNPDYIHNFKGEPSYRTKELLPDYWEQISKKKDNVKPIDIAPIRGDIQYLAFCDARSGNYYRGTFDRTTQQLILNATSSVTQIKDFLKQHGLPVGDFIPEWNFIYDPHNNERVNVASRTVNLFEPSEFMRSTPVPRSTPPANILAVIHHVLGGDEAVTRHFINWLAYIVQRRTRTLTAWVLHGTTKTGKGILIHRIIKPLLGASNVAIRTQDNLAERWTDFLEHALVVFVDEMEHTALENSRGVMAKLKNHITEETVAIRAMHRTVYEVQNRTNWIFASNRPNPLAIDREDRRINVANYQAIQTTITPEKIDELQLELQHFYDYLALTPLDIAAVHTPLPTQDRFNLISISESSIDDVMNHIKDGDFDFFIDQLPTNNSYKVDINQLTKVETYISILKALIARTNNATGVCNIDRDELRSILAYVSGLKTDSPHKFTALMKHHKTVIQAVWLSDISKTVRGIPAIWKNPENFDRHLTHFVATKQPLRAVK